MRKNIMKKLITAVCTVSMVMGSISFGAMAEEQEALEITKQPTVGNPTVEVNKTDGVEYQWYESIEENDTTLVGSIYDEENDYMYVVATGAEYDEEDNKFIDSSGYLYITFKAKEGDVIYVTPKDGSDISVTVCGSSQTMSEGVFVTTYMQNQMWQIVCESNVEGESAVATVELERNGTRYTLINGVNKVIDGKETVDSNLVYDEVDGFWSENRSMLMGTTGVSVYMHEGEYFLSEFEESVTGAIGIMFEDNNSVDSVVNFENTQRNVIFAKESGWYNIMFNIEDDFRVKMYRGKVVMEQPVEGQTTNTLTEFEDGKVYRCKVSEGNKELWSDYIVGNIMIMTQPTAADPTVKLNYDVDASYQWYNMDFVREDDLGENQNDIVRVYNGEYSDGKWNSELIVNSNEVEILFGVKPGNKIVVELPEDFQGTVEDRNEKIVFSYNDGVYEGMVDSNITNCYIYIKSDEAFVANIYEESLDIKEPIEGETKATLMTPEVGKYYVCKVLYNGIELISDVVDMQIVVSKQPTLEELAVDVNFPEEVTGYQWFTAKEIVWELVDGLGGELGENEIPAFSYCGVYEDGKWNSASEGMAVPMNGEKGILLVCQLEGGKTLNIVPSVEADYTINMINTSTTQYITPNKKEDKYIFDIQNTSMYMIQISLADDFSAEFNTSKMVKDEVIEGQTEKKLTKHEPGEYICEISLEDGSKIYSDVIIITENDDVHVYTDMYDADCNECGDIREVPDRPVEPEDKPGTENGGTENGSTENGGTENGGTENGGTGNGSTSNGGTVTDDTTVKDDDSAPSDATLKKVKAVEELISKLPTTITKNDEAAIKEALAAYNALSEAERKLLDKKLVMLLEAAKAEIEKLNKTEADKNNKTEVDKDNKTENVDSPDTGDNHNMWIWFAMLLVSGVCTFGYTLKKKMD